MLNAETIADSAKKASRRRGKNQEPDHAMIFLREYKRTRFERALLLRNVAVKLAKDGKCKPGGVDIRVIKSESNNLLVALSEDAAGFTVDVWHNDRQVLCVEWWDDNDELSIGLFCCGNWEELILAAYLEPTVAALSAPN